MHSTNLARTSVTKNQGDLLAQSDNNSTIYITVVLWCIVCVDERHKELKKQYADIRNGVEELLQRSKELEKSNYRLIQTNETMKAHMELEVSYMYYNISR